MSDMIPDSISTADLEAFAKNAPEEQAAEGIYGGKTDEELCDYVHDVCEHMANEVPHAMLPKLVIITMVSSLLGWHSRRGMSISMGGTEQERCETAMSWHRDAGKLQAILNIVESIDCGEGDDDFTCK